MNKIDIAKITFGKYILFGILCALAGTAAAQTPRNKIKVLSYYSGQPAGLDSVDVSQMTDIIFCFGRLDGNRFKVRRAQDTLTILKMVSLKAKNPDLKVLLSLGGWGGCATCSDVFATEIGRKEFTQSIRELYDYFKVDGLDLDWEYPGVQGPEGHKFTPEDKPNFTLLVKELRKLGKKYQLSFAAGGSQRFIDHAIEWKKVMKNVDFVNLMSYDLAGGTRATHHTALFSTEKQPRSADTIVKTLLRIGVPARKIVVGGAFYGKLFDVPGIEGGPYQTGTQKGTVNYKQVATQMPKTAGWQYLWDEAAHAPYIYNPQLKQLFVYDDKRSIAEKTRYVIDNRLGGIMFWQLGGDIYRNGLLNEINTVKTTYQPDK